MWKYLSSLFAKAPQLTPEEVADDQNPGALAMVMDDQDGFAGRAHAGDVEEARKIHGEFVEKVCLRPGMRLVEHLQSSGAGLVVDWFQPETLEPEPKALMQLFVDLSRRGQTISDQPGFDIFLQGRWSSGGGCSDASYEALMHLVKATGRPINYFFQESPRDEGYLITKIEPK